MLPIDVEVIISKIYSHFYIYTVRTTELKDFCDDVEITYKKLLGYSKTRWLALLPGVERVLMMFPALQSYFLSQDKSPVILHNFFSNPCSELWLKFVHHQASIFHGTVTILEADHLNFCEVGEIIIELEAKFQSRLDESYVPIVLKNDLKVLVNEGEINENYFMGQVRNFYNNIVDYLHKYSEQYSELQQFNWVQLKKNVQWSDVEESVIYFNENVTNVNDNVLFDEITLVSAYVKANAERWLKENTRTDNKWLEIFKYFNENGKPLCNCKLIVQFILSIPGTNAATERVFSLMNAMWTSEKEAMKVETVGAMLEVKHNMGTCLEFRKILAENTEVLKKIHSSEKYDFKSRDVNE